ncbi:MAG: hypothetical protein ACR2P0_01310, partial [Acidimicrobiales bacterium]
MTRASADDLLILGGRQRRAETLRGDEEDIYGEAVALVLNTDDFECREVVGYRTPADACASDAPTGVFKAGSVQGDHIYTCTQTEVLVWSAKSFELLVRITKPFFNDIHHVAPTPRGTLLVVVTGLDLVVELSMDGEVVRE